ncbi:MAG: hypothetical protein Q7R64_04675 [bacterium]|nr:hypothetical protein [bacterium]
MNKNDKPKRRVPKRIFLKMVSLLPIQNYLQMWGIPLNARTQSFLRRHNVDTVGNLLMINIIFERDSVWKALSPLREKLISHGFASHRHPFLMSYI